MITQFQLTLIPDKPCPPRPEWSYCLYAALLKQAPRRFGEEVHQNTVTPVSQYLRLDGKYPVWVITLLGEASEQKLGAVLAQTQGFMMDRQHIRLRVAGRTCRCIKDVDELFAQAAQARGIHRLQFVTPTAFKSQGKYVNLPTPRLIIQNLINKWNGCVTECPIEDADGQGMETLAAGLVCREFHLSSQEYPLKGHTISGFVGTLTLENRLSGFHRQLADALLLFACYAGVGIKTTLGMGGVAALL